jgi:hypothetical protein
MSMSQNKSDVVPPQRPSTQPNRPHIRRHHNVLYTDAEWAHLQAIARLCGKTRSEFIRDVSLRRRVRVKPFLANADLVRELAKSGMALTHLAATARESGALPVAADLETALAALRALLRRIAYPEAASGARC